MTDAVNRSGNPYSAPRDGNRVPTLLGVSTVDGITPVPLEVNPSTGQLQTSSSGGGGGAVTISDGGTTGVNVLAAGTPQSQGNAALVAPTTYSVPFSFTSATNGTAYDVGNYRWVSVQVNTQYTSSTINFQGSNDNSTWISISLTSAGTTTGTATLSTTGSSVIYSGALNFRYFRVTASGTYSSGTAAGVIVFSSATGFPSGIGVSTFGTGALTTGNITSSSGSVVSGTVTGDGGYAIIAVTGTYAGVSFGITQSESGGTTFYPVAVYDDIAGIWLSPSSTITPGTNATRTYRVPIYPYSSQIKLLASAYTSGTMAVRISMGTSSTLAPSTMAQLMDAAGNNRGANVDAGNNLNTHDLATGTAGGAMPTSNIFIGASDTTNLQYLTVASGLGDGASGSHYLDVDNRLYNGSTFDRQRSGGVTGMAGVSIQASPTGAFTYGHISTSTTTTLKSGAGTLHNVSVNTLGTVASTATIYDSTTGSGTVIGVINTLNLSGSFILDVAFTTGLTIVTTGTVAPDLTVAYK